MSFQLSPNVDKNKIFLVKHSQLKGRLDTVFYHPKYRANEEAIKNSKWGYEKISHTARRIADGPFGSDLKVDEYQLEGNPLLRVSNIRTGEVEGNLVYISDEKQEQLKRSKVYPNDVLLTKAGAVLGYSAVFPESLREGNITSHLVTITCRDGIDPHYLSHFFRSNVGQLQIYRWGNKSTRPELNTSEVESILVTTPPPDVQFKIVERLNAAYTAKKQKEEESQRLLDSIDDYLLSELGINLLEPEENTIQNRVFYRKLSEVSGGRFDPNNYQNERLEAINSLKNGIFPVKKLCEIVAFRSIKTNEISEETVYVGMENITSNTGEIVTTNEKDSISSASIFMKNDVLFPKLRPYLNKVYCAEEEGICSTEFHVLHSNSECNEFIANFLRSRVVVSQTKCLTSGNTLPRLQLEDINKFLIPIPPLEKQIETVDRITTIRTQAKQLRQAAAAELEQAKQEVEAMILG